MIQGHKLDAPDHIEGVTSADQFDESNLGAFYPEPKKDTRPLIMSDAERHRQHDATLANERGQLHREVVPIALYLVIPPTIVYIAYSYISQTMNQDNMILFFPIAILTGIVVLVLLNWLYSHAAGRIHTHGVHHISFMITDLLLTLGLTAGIAFLTALTTPNMKDVLIVSAVGIGASFVVTKFLVILATARLWAPRQKS